MTTGEYHIPGSWPSCHHTPFNTGHASQEPKRGALGQKNEQDIEHLMNTTTDLSQVSIRSSSASCNQSCVCCKILQHRAQFDIKVDTQVPVEVWQHIFEYVEYPSQLSRLSRTCRTFCNLIPKMRVWDYFFRKLYLCMTPPDVPTVPGMRRKLQMRRLCAESLHICESCFRFCPGASNRSSEALPLPVPVAWLEVSTESRENQEDAEGWTIQVCLECRKNIFKTFTEPIPHGIAGSYIGRREIQEKYSLGKGSIKNITRRQGGGRKSRSSVVYYEMDALMIARQAFGGDVGIQAENSHHR